MAPLVEARPAMTLRMVTQRLSTTPTTLLPHVAPLLAGSVTETREVFAASQNEGSSKSSSEMNVLIHKLKAQLSALLQEKAPQARFSALIIIKATVEVGGWNILQGVGSWVRGMIGIMGRPDSPATKKLCIVTLTRIFLFTHAHQSLVREITTPSLSPFITAALNATVSSTAIQGDRAPPTRAPLLSVVLQAFGELIVLHPTSFRPFTHQIQLLLLPLIAPTPSNIEIEAERHTLSAHTVQLARRLYTLLHVCAPKNTAADEWQKSLQGVIISTQKTANRLFRCFVEDRRLRMETTGLTDLLEDEVVCDRSPQPLALPGWMGVHAGIERLDGLLGVVQAFLSCTTSAAVALPVSSIVSLFERVLSTLQSRWTRSSRMRPEIGRDEREGLELGVPQLHVSALRILSVLMSRMRSGFMAMATRTLEQVLRVLEIEHMHDKIRTASYTVVSQVVAEFGPTLPASCVKPISRCVKLCCEDLLPSHESQAQESWQLLSKGRTQSNGKKSVNDADSYLETAATASKKPDTSVDVLAAAEKLLILSLTNLPPGFLSIAVRTRVDRTAIMTKNNQAMLASVLNPPAECKGQQATTSILPMLARADNGDLSLETLLRPQMPMMQVRSIDNNMNTPGDEEEMERDYETSNLPRNDAYNDTSDFSRRANLDNDLGEGPNGNVDPPHPVNGSPDNPALATSGNNLPDAEPSPHMSGLSHISSKRNRQSSLPLDLNREDELAETQYKTSRETEASSKRARLDLSEAELVQETNNNADDNDISEDRPLATTSSKSSLTKELTEVERLDSDESDFEMPILHLDPDSDEEDDDEDVTDL